MTTAEERNVEVCWRPLFEEIGLDIRRPSRVKLLVCAVGFVESGRLAETEEQVG